MPYACHRYPADGEHALSYLARSLYRGVLSEADMLGIEGESVRFCYRDEKLGEFRTRSLSGADFLWLLLAHVLPRGFRRCRSYGLLHHRRTHLLQRVQLMLRVVLPPAEPRARRPLLCKHCGQPMRIRPATPPRPCIESVQTLTPAEGHGTVYITRRRRQRKPRGDARRNNSRGMSRGNEKVGELPARKTAALAAIRLEGGELTPSASAPASHRPEPEKLFP